MKTKKSLNKSYLKALIMSLLVSLLVLTGCSGNQSPSNSSSEEIVIFAASSLTNAMEELGEEFEAEHENVTVAFNFASSSQLATQLIEGGTADVYASANQTQMQNVVDAGQITQTPNIFATNFLVIAVPAENPANISSIEDLTLPNLQLVLAGPEVPVRVYSDEVIQSYGNQAFQDQVYANLVSEEANVRQVVTKISLGEADAGMVYSSDITPDIANTIKVISIPKEHNVIATYPIGLIANSSHPESAQEFINFVLSDAGQSILNNWGFGPIP